MRLCPVAVVLQDTQIHISQNTAHKDTQTILIPFIKFELNTYNYKLQNVSEESIWYSYMLGRPPLWSSGESSWLHNVDVLFPVRYELNLYMLCRRK
jgi:hypothetical protein